VRVLSLSGVTIVGLLLSAIGLWQMSTWTPVISIDQVGLWLAVFGFGFGLTVTPRTTAAIEAVGQRYFGMASATVTVARMIGMAVGLAILVAYGSTTIDRLSAQVYATPDAYRQFIPPRLQDRPLKDGLVVQALETWAAGEAGRIIAGLFLVAGAMVLVAIPPSLALGGRRSGALVQPGPEGVVAGSIAGVRDGQDEPEPTFAI